MQHFQRNPYPSINIGRYVSHYVYSTYVYIYIMYMAIYPDIKPLFLFCWYKIPTDIFTALCH